MQIKYKEHIPLVVFLILAVVSFFIIKPILLSVFLGGFLAYLCYPLHNFLGNKIKNKVIPPLLVSIIVIVVIAVPGSFLLKALAEQSYSLFLLGKERISVGYFQDCSNGFCSLAKNIIQGLDLNLHLQDVLKSITTWVIRKGSDILISLPRFLLNLFVVFFTMFYFLKDGKEFSRKVGDFLSMKEKRYPYILQRLQEIIHGLVFGYIMVAILQGALGAIGFAIFGVSSPLFWGVIMTFLALIPSLGTGLVWFPASLILFLEGVFQDSNTLIIKGILLLAYSLIFVGTIDNILKPKIVSGKAKVHPAVICVGILWGLFLFGMWGVILGPLILSLTVVFLEVLFLQQSASEEKSILI